MISSIYNTKLIELAPSSKKDKNSKIFYEVVEEAIKKHIVEKIKYLVAMDRIDELEERYVDLLAEEMHIDYYDLSNNLEEKRSLVKLSLLTHMKKGTPFSVETILNIFFENTKLKEWFNYGKAPGTFEIEILNNTLINPEHLKKMLEIIEVTKRKSQHMSGVVFSKRIDSNVYPTAYSRQYIRQELHPAKIDFTFNRVKIYPKQLTKVYQRLKIKGGQ